MGIDLIWFGVLLAVNMQTSFMHPPFGFALFFLRSVAPDKQYVDRVTHKVIEPVTTMQIYKGAVPFVLIQLVMVGVLIAFPGIVTGALDKPVVVDMQKIDAQMMDQLGDHDGGYGADNPFATPDAPADAGAADATPAPAAEGYGSDDPAKALQDSLGTAPAESK
jgi:hypothetical protein